MNDHAVSTMKPAAALQQVLSQLADKFRDRASTGQAIREQHGKDASFHPAVAPDVVVYPESTQEVSFVASLCHAHRIAVVSFGTGTGCEGGVGALHGGVCIDMSRMKQVLQVNAQDMDCRVQAGVTRKQLNNYLHDTGLFFPIDPGADASIGGMVSTRASGTNAVRYGTMRDNVLSLQVVLADGEIIETGGRARKSSAGYDLTRLFTGAEGTLGVVTEVTVKLHAIAERISAARCSYPSLKAAVDSVIQIIQMGTPIGRVELLDEQQVAACNRYSKLDLPVAPTLFFEFQGPPAAVDEQIVQVRAVCAEHGGADFAWAATSEDRNRLWQARHDVFWAALALRPGSEAIPTDVCVPISRLTEAVLAARQDVEELGMTAPMCGHVGDGNFHLCIVVNPGDADEMRRAEILNGRLVRRAIEMEGTCTGEHGIGYGKLDYLEEERGASMKVMAAMKRALDPRNIMNPGKVVRPGNFAPFA